MRGSRVFRVACRSDNRKIRAQDFHDPLLRRGGGVCGGYRWIFRERLSLSAEAGIGYLYTDYQYALDLYGMLVRQGHNYSHYAGPTRLALTLAIDFKRRKR